MAVTGPEALWAAAGAVFVALMALGAVYVLWVLWLAVSGIARWLWRPRKP